MCDVGKRESVYSTAEKVRQEVGEVDILINNAGVVSGHHLLECPDELIERTMVVNCHAHFWVSRRTGDEDGQKVEEAELYVDYRMIVPYVCLGFLSTELFSVFEVFSSQERSQAPGLHFSLFQNPKSKMCAF